MKIRQVLLAVVALAAIGVLAFLARMTQTVDNTLHLERLRNIRIVDALDVGLNRAVTQVGVSSLANTADERATTTAQLGDALNALEQGNSRVRGLDPKVDESLSRFLDTIESKFELAFDFEARNILINQRLIAGMDAVPVLADQLLAQTPEAQREALGSQLAQLKTEVTTHGVVQTPTNEASIRALIDELTKAGETQSEEWRGTLGLLTSRSLEVMADKAELVQRLSDFLQRPTAAQLQAMEQAYMNWHNGQVAIANQYRLWLTAYAAVLLLIVALIGLRLRRSYRDLDRANEELSNANENLEGQVQARTKDLSAALDDLRASQAQLVQSEKMASLGQMVAGVAHEINTPLGYARSNTEIVRTSLREIRELCGAQNRALQLMGDESAPVDDVALALEEARRRAEELNAEELAGDLDGLLGDADHGLSQIAELVGSLKDFSRVDRSRNDVFNVNDGIESALKIAQNQFKHRVEVVKSFAQLPAIECSPSQLNQVFLNLFTNAAQAIEGEGKIFVHTSTDPRGVAIRVLDTGCGMSEDVRSRIFEPFFTTKPVGKGTGLGLSIVFRIIEDHGGTIEVRSQPGKGSEFIIVLPLKQQRRPLGAADDTSPTPPNPALAA
jgi:two-component system NtrC family sensor kinase